MSGEDGTGSIGTAWWGGEDRNGKERQGPAVKARWGMERTGWVGTGNMNKTEFSEWLKYHDARFSGLLAFFRKCEDTEATKRAWWEELQRVTLEEAQNASRALFDGDHPAMWRQHPQAIRALVRASRGTSASPARRTNWLNGQPVYRCQLCQDSGAVAIYNPNDVAATAAGVVSAKRQRFVDDAAKHGKTIRVPMLPVSAACNCSAGDGFSSKWRNPPARYNPDVHVLWGNDTDGDRQRMAETAVASVETARVPATSCLRASGCSDCRRRSARPSNRADAGLPTTRRARDDLPFSSDICRRGTD